MRELLALFPILLPLYFLPRPAATFSCLGASGSAVDWFIAIKYPGSNVPPGNFYSVVDSTAPGAWFNKRCSCISHRLSPSCIFSFAILRSHLVSAYQFPIRLPNWRPSYRYGEAAVCCGWQQRHQRAVHPRHVQRRSTGPISRLASVCPRQRGSSCQSN